MSMAVAMTPAAAFAEETSTEEATEVVSEVASEEDTDAEEESSEAETKAFDYSEGYDEKGFFEGVKALDYVTLLDYSHMELSDEIIPSDEAVQSQIDKTLSSYTKTNQITDEDRLIEDGDTVNIDYVGSVDGVEFEGGSTDGKGATVTIGVTNFIDGFLDQLIGHAPGENFDINVTFPDPYTKNTDLSGKDAVFNITINYIEEKITPEFDDDFIAENLPDYESAEAYRQSVYDNLYKQNMYNALFQYVVENSEIKDVPEEVVDTVYNERYQYYTSIASMYGVGIDAFLSANGLDEDSFRDEDDGIISPHRQPYGCPSAFPHLKNVWSTTVPRIKEDSRTIVLFFSSQTGLAPIDKDMKLRHFVIGEGATFATRKKNY